MVKGVLLDRCRVKVNRFLKMVLLEFLVGLCLELFRLGQLLNSTSTQHPTHTHPQHMHRCSVACCRRGDLGTQKGANFALPCSPQRRNNTAAPSSFAEHDTDAFAHAPEEQEPRVRGSGKAGWNGAKGGTRRLTCSGEGGERGELTMVTSSLASESDLSDIWRVASSLSALIRCAARGSQPLETQKRGEKIKLCFFVNQRIHGLDCRTRPEICKFLLKYPCVRPKFDILGGVLLENCLLSTICNIYQNKVSLPMPSWHALLFHRAHEVMGHLR